MTAFRYQAIEASGAPIEGVVEAEDRRAALLLLGERGLYPSRLEAGPLQEGAAAPETPVAALPSPGPGWARRGRVRRKEITAFTGK